MLESRGVEGGEEDLHSTISEENSEHSGRKLMRDHTTPRGERSAPALEVRRMLYCKWRRRRHSEGFVRWKTAASLGADAVCSFVFPPPTNPIQIKPDTFGCDGEMMGTFCLCVGFEQENWS